MHVLKSIGWIALMALPLSIHAQKHEHGGDQTSYTHPVMQHQAVQWNGGFEIQNDAVSELISHIYSQHPQLAGSGLIYDTQISSPGGTHYHFFQTINGQRVFGSHIVANVNTNQEVGSITANIYSTDLADGTPLMENGDILSNDEFRTAPQRGIWFFNGQDLEPAIRYVIIDGPLYEERVFDASNTMIWNHDMNMYIDTTIQVAVFNPDPLTTFQTSYGGVYVDLNDQNEVTLNPARETKSILADYSGGQFRLQNAWIRIADFDAPSVTPVTQATDFFNYGRSDNRFEQVNAFYHMTNFQLHMQSLGFSLVNYQMPVDANALSGQDNSRFSTASNPPDIAFGEGGVDDAEDADVIIHEYGHAIAFSASPNSNSGTERRCLDEALGDYLAASYSRAINPYRYDRVFSWDGHNEFWSGREGLSNKNYQTLSFVGIYQHTDVWVSALMEIWGEIGRNITDEIVLESLHGYTTNMTMVQAALLVVEADSNLYNGQHIQPIWKAFVNRGILPSNPISLEEINRSSDVLFFNTQAFASGGNVDVRLNSSSSFEYRLMDLGGRVISHGSIPSGTEQWTYSGYGLSSGAYMMVIQDEKGQVFREKLIRTR